MSAKLNKNSLFLNCATNIVILTNSQLQSVSCSALVERSGLVGMKTKSVSSIHCVIIG